MAYPEAKIVLEAAEELRPFLRGMNPNEDLQKQAEKLLFASGEERGFNKLMQFLRGNK